MERKIFELTSINIETAWITYTAQDGNRKLLQAPFVTFVEHVEIPSWNGNAQCYSTEYKGSYIAANIDDEFLNNPLFDAEDKMIICNAVDEITIAIEAILNLKPYPDDF